MSDLNLALIGNCSFGALVDQKAKIVWSCMPHFEGDPVFCSMLNGSNKPTHEESDSSPWGFYDVQLEDFEKSEQRYIENTAILETILYSKNGSALKITDFAPRYKHHGRYYKPTSIVRIIEPLIGSPRITIRVRPRFEYGAVQPHITRGSNHMRFVSDDLILRLTTDAPTVYIKEERPFNLTGRLSLILGPDESLRASVGHECLRWLDRTRAYWNEFTRELALPFEWQEEVIRSAITLKLCTFEETGAVLAAITTSVPEAPDTPRNWDYRFCWLRDSYFVIHTMNRLGSTQAMEDYINFIMNLTVGREDGFLQPVFGIDQRHDLTESEVESLSGYRGMGPVRIGNKAYEQVQNDVFGSVVLASIQAFFDQRIGRRGTIDDFRMLERMGQKAIEFYDKPDAGLWELREKARVHTFSAVMCWAACDRLAKIADHLGLKDRKIFWSKEADTMKDVIIKETWNPKLNCFMESFGADDPEYLDASLLLLHEIGFIEAKDPRFIGTVEAVEARLKKDGLMYRYILEDDFGKAETAFTICTFWYIDALHAIGREDEARALFEMMLAKRNHVGLLSEDLDFKTGELWGNFPQTYSMVGLIKSAMRLSRQWEDML